MQRRNIATPIFRTLACTVAVLSISVVLSVASFRDRPFTAGLVFLFPVLIVSALWGLRYALFVSLLSALAFDLSIPPAGRLQISDPRDALALIAFLFTAIITSYLADRARKEAADAEARHAEAVAAHRRFTDLVNSVEGIVWEADAQTFAFTFVSEQAERILAYPTEQWLCEPTFWQDHIHPEDREMAVQRCIHATAEKRNHDVEYRMIATDGRVVWIRDLVTVVVEDGHATRLRGVMVNVTKRRQREEAMREQANLLNLTHNAIFVRDMNSVITYWNRGAEELYGWTAHEAIGKISNELLKTVFAVSLQEIEERLVHSGRWEGELVHTKKFGTPVIVASRWSLQRDEKGVPVAILETNNDITEWKRTEQARDEIEEQWRAAFQSNPTMYFIVDQTGNIVTVNAFGAQQLGYKVDELMGQSVLNVFYEPDKEAVKKHGQEDP
jgi:PAS domain S-box-containing protein